MARANGVEEDPFATSHEEASKRPRSPSTCGDGDEDDEGDED